MQVPARDLWETSIASFNLFWACLTNAKDKVGCPTFFLSHKTMSLRGYQQSLNYSNIELDTPPQNAFYRAGFSLDALVFLHDKEMGPHHMKFVCTRYFLAVQLPYVRID